MARQFFGKIVRRASGKGLDVEQAFFGGWDDGGGVASQSASGREAGEEGRRRADGGGRNRRVDFRGQQRRNETQEPATDAQARLWRKSQTAEVKGAIWVMCWRENRHGLIGNVRVTRAHGRAEREAAVEMAREIPGGRKRVTLGADRGYDTREFVEQLKDRNVTAHVAQNVNGRRSAADSRTTRHEGYWVSQRRRKGVEELFG